MGTTPTGILSAPKDKLRRALAASPTMQSWMGRGSTPLAAAAVTGATTPATNGTFVAAGAQGGQIIYFCEAQQMYLFWDAAAAWCLSSSIEPIFNFGRPPYWTAVSGLLFDAAYLPQNGASGTASVAAAASVLVPKIRYDFVRGNDDQIRQARPFAIIEWNHFALKQIAGGDQNFLWPDSPVLRVILTDNDPVQPQNPTTGLSDDELMEGDILFENRVGAVLQDLANIAASGGFLSTAEIDLDMPPTRNPLRDWPSAGSYHWCSFTVAYD